MAFRTQAAALALLTALPAVAAVAAEYRVRHVHLRHGAEGVLRIDAQSISFEESGKHRDHSRRWKLDDIRQLTLGPNVLRIQTYERRNRVFVFDQLPPELAKQWYPVFSAQRDQRFVAALADDRIHPDWQIPVRGGELMVGAAEAVFRADVPDASRTWRISDIESVSSAGPFDLTLTTREREFRFELKQVLPAARYQEFWRRVNRAQGLEILND